MKLIICAGGVGYPVVKDLISNKYITIDCEYRKKLWYYRNPRRYPMLRDLATHERLHVGMIKQG